MKLADVDEVFTCKDGHRFHSSLTLLKPTKVTWPKTTRVIYVNHNGYIIEGAPMGSWDDKIMACPKCGESHLRGFKIKKL